MNLDRYAQDYALWRDSASINYTAAKTLFETGDPFLFFPAATLGHHALEMYLKAGLVANGMTVFNPKELNKLDVGVNLAKANCDGLGGEHKFLLDALVAELRHARFTWNNASFSLAAP